MRHAVQGQAQGERRGGGGDRQEEEHGLGGTSVQVARNVGVAPADAEYVYFVDQDDWLGDEALERMVRFGRSNGSDIVIARQAGHHRRVAKELFERTLPSATLFDAPLMSSLTPHAMFRKQFLDAHGLRFPEGRRRLEDHVFVTRAYLLAE